jgi:hypothetical protein
VTGEWKLKDNAMVLEVGTIANSELKSVNVQIQLKKGEKPDYPVVLKALLKFNDRVLSEAAPLTLLTKPPKVSPEGVEAQATPAKIPTPAAHAQPSDTNEP